MKIWYSPYTLKALSTLNSRSAAADRKGALLKIEFSEGLTGYSDLHPHTELGDRELSEQLDCLSRDESTVLINRSLHWALIDAHARKKGESLFRGRSLPKTHAIATDVIQLEADHLDKLNDLGYSFLKVKMGRDLPDETLKILELSQHLGGMKLRLDFNESLDQRVFRDWWKQVHPALQAHVDYIEDPFPYSGEKWGESGAPLALDRSLSLENLKSFDGSVVIFKPAVSDTHWLNNINHRVVFSTYMDHPLGEMSAIFAAAQHYNDVGKEQVGGLRTWHLFDSNEFSESLQGDGPELRVAEGTGLGFDEQLKAQNWKPLK